MTKKNLKLAKKALKNTIIADFNNNGAYYGSSCSDMSLTIHAIGLNYGKPGFGWGAATVSGFTCNGTNPFIDYWKIMFSYNTTKDGSVELVDWWVKWN